MRSTPSTPPQGKTCRPSRRCRTAEGFSAIWGLLILLILLVSDVSSWAGAIYIWKDDAGVVHMTDARPAEPADLIGVQRYSDKESRPVEAPSTPPPEDPTGPAEAALTELREKARQARNRAAASGQKAEKAADVAAKLREEAEAMADKGKTSRLSRKDAKRLNIDLEKKMEQVSEAEAKAADARIRAAEDAAVAESLEKQLSGLESIASGSKPEK